MKRGAVFALLVPVCLLCSCQKETPKDSSAPVTSDSPAPSTTTVAPTPTRTNGDQSLASVELVDRFLRERYGDAVPQSEEQLRAVAAADEYLDQRRRRVAQPRRYLVRRTSSGWDVTVLSLDALRRAEQERSGGVIVSLAEKEGHLVGVSLAVQD